MPLVDGACAAAAGFRAAGSDVVLTPTRHAALVGAVESLPQFAAAVRELRALSRYAARVLDTDIHAYDCRAEFGAFLTRSGFYASIWTGSAPTPAALLDEFDKETSRARCTVTRRIPIDGLSIAGNDPIVFPGGRLIKVTESDWRSFFEADWFSAPNLSALSNLWVFDLEEAADIEPDYLWGALDPVSRRIARLVGNWLCYVNAWSAECVRPLALYVKPDTRLSSTAVGQITIASPSWTYQTHPESGDQDEVPFLPVHVDEHDRARFVDFLLELERGRTAAVTQGPRMATALHWFSRITGNMFGTSYDWVDETVAEDVVADSFTVLEALLLRSGEKCKGAKIAARAAALIAPDLPAREVLADQIRAAYKRRNDLVHGDVRPNRDVLEATMRDLRVWTRQVLVAMLRLEGDQDRVIRGVTDPLVQARNHAFVPMYEGL